MAWSRSTRAHGRQAAHAGARRGSFLDETERELCSATCQATFSVGRGAANVGAARVSLGGQLPGAAQRAAGGDADVRPLALSRRALSARDRLGDLRRIVVAAVREAL